MQWTLSSYGDILKAHIYNKGEGITDAYEISHQILGESFLLRKNLSHG